MRRRPFVLPWAAILAGCGGSTETSGNSDATIDAIADTSAGDASVDGTGDAHDGSAVIDSDILCGDARCGAGEICMRGRCAGCCDVPPSCAPIPSGCTGANLACDCFTTDPCGGCTTCQSVEVDGVHCGNCMCKCSAPWTLIDTPEGPRRIADLRAGDVVYSVHRGERKTVPIARIGRRPTARGHTLVRVTLVGGAVIEMSGTHPTADGRPLRTLVPGDWLGEQRVAAVGSIPYDEPFTYDILPASDTGTYFSSGAWLGSTMHRPFERARDHRRRGTEAGHSVA